ncbi:MAG: Hpt domain-containing protein, partial [Actinomycetota bacterium]|nr:Hpt domain-containing protein [Actinomycetota bacterium]
MSWSNDPELQQMFVEEVTERSARLIEGAQSLRAGAMTPQEAGDLLREGHTIKGTGRVMGYEDVGSAGLMLEMLWRWIQHGDLTPDPNFGRALESLSAAIPRAVDDPAELAVAMEAIHEFLEGQSLPEELPPAPVVDSAADLAATPPTSPVPESSLPPASDAQVPPPPQVRSVTEETVIHFDRSAEISAGEPVEGTEPTADEAANETETRDTETEPEVAMSAQEAFAALRQSTQSDPTESATHDPLEAVDPDSGGIAVHEDAGAEETIGSVIEFPGSASDGTTDHSDDRVIRHDRLNESVESESGEVVVLPSSGKVAARASMDPADLGGLV